MPIKIDAVCATADEPLSIQVVDKARIVRHVPIQIIVPARGTNPHHATYSVRRVCCRHNPKGEVGGKSTGRKLVCHIVPRRAEFRRHLMHVEVSKIQTDDCCQGLVTVICNSQSVVCLTARESSLTVQVGTRWTRRGGGYGICPRFAASSVQEARRLVTNGDIDIIELVLVQSQWRRC